MTILYIIIVMILTPIIYERVNRKLTKNQTLVNRISGFPSYSLMLAVCIVEGLVVCLLPGGWGFSFTHWLFATAVIFLGNQFIFNTFIKLMSAARVKVGI